MQIKKKIDVNSVLDNFTSISYWDAKGQKHYLVFEDRIRGGQWTLMKYGASDQFSVHGIGENYSDDEELFFDNRDSVASFLWENRSAYNVAVKKLTGVFSIEYKNQLAGEPI
ncbi:hypothetical protein [Cohnella sp.]|uniref:hypothetical protein n=1 Tax=Cohnella sp. TaxID=1883426 RepID=UPI003561BCFC